VTRLVKARKFSFEEISNVGKKKQQKQLNE